MTFVLVLYWKYTTILLLTCPMKNKRDNTTAPDQINLSTNTNNWCSSPCCTIFLFSKQLVSLCVCSPSCFDSFKNVLDSMNCCALHKVAPGQIVVFRLCCRLVFVEVYWFADACLVMLGLKVLWFFEHCLNFVTSKLFQMCAELE